MPPERKLIPIAGHRLVIQITDDDSRTLIDPSGEVAYHSASGAAAETRHVYLNNSGIADRLSRGQSTSVLEIGLGMGLGLLMTLDAACNADAAMTYVAVENELLDADVLSQLEMDRQLSDPSLAERFFQWRRSLSESSQPEVVRWHVEPKQIVEIHCCDARRWQIDAGRRFDAIYFDPFSPDANPELWQPEFLALMHELLDDEGRLVTYCVNRRVRDDFAAVGFHVARTAGPPGGKREVMIATKRG